MLTALYCPVAWTCLPRHFFKKAERFLWWFRARTCPEHCCRFLLCERILWLLEKTKSATMDTQLLRSYCMWKFRCL